MSRTRGIGGGRLWRAALIAALGALTACGTTLQASTRHAGVGGSTGTLSSGSGGGSGSELGGGTSSGNGGGSGRGAPTGAGTSSGTGGGSGPGLGLATGPGGGNGTGVSASGTAAGPSGRAGTGGAGPGGSPGAAGGSVSNVPGVKDGQIYFGYVNLVNQGAERQALGQAGFGGLDFNQTFVDLANYINTHGGIRGLKIKLVPFNRDATDQNTTEASWEQKECVAWTQDTRVFAAYQGEGHAGVLDPCLNKAGVIEMCGGCVLTTYDDQEFAKFPLLYEPAGASVSRVVPAYVQGLVQAGFFNGPAVKIGLLAFDNARYHQAAGQLAQVLKGDGLSLADQAFVQEAQSAQDYGPALTELQNYELKFKSEQINRVLVLDESGAILGYGTTIADKQQWYPHWGVNSTSGPAGLIASGAYDPPSERSGQTVVGWVPGADEGYEFKDSQRPPGLDPCLKILQDYGITPSGDNNLGAVGQQCDTLFFFRAALQAAGTVSVPAFQTGAASLGSSFGSALTYVTQWTSARRDGAGIYRSAVYDAGCGCLAYVGTPHSM